MAESLQILKSLRKWVCLLALMAVQAWTGNALANNAGAVVLVNSQSPRYLDFQHFIQPYLGNFGVPYVVMDISSNAPIGGLTNYALIIIGHAALDTNQIFLTLTVQSNIVLAISNGVGLVSFDNILAGSSNAPPYAYEQAIFGFGFTNSVAGPTITFPTVGTNGQMPYLTALHQTNAILTRSVLTLSNTVGYSTMTVPGFVAPSNATVAATCGGNPLVVTIAYGQGRAVQWGSYDWMSSTVQGPINGLDDLVWRGFVWAARKPFVMRGFPNFVTLRVDDVAGPFWWVHTAANSGFKPFLALFTDNVSTGNLDYNDGRLADLSNLTAGASVTASMHSFSNETNDFFYFNHVTETQWPDSTMASNYVLGTQWFSNYGIPFSKVVALHYAEIGSNAFNGLTNWGVEYVLMNVVPGTVEYTTPGAPWLVGGPYRLYEVPQAANSDMPNYYADFLSVPNHPELNGKFFNAYCWIRNVGPNGEWGPEDNDIPGSISRGYNMVKRCLDSMVMATLMTHEFYIQYGGTQYISTNDWLQMIQGITNALAPYNPIYVTLDYGCQYLRATRTSQMLSADVNPATGQVSAVLAGTTDLPLSVNVYTGADLAITNTPGTVPVFSGVTNVVLGSLNPSAQLTGLSMVRGRITFNVIGQFGCAYTIQASSDLLNWSNVMSLSLTNGPAVVTVPVAPSIQFYRAKFLQ